MFPKCLHIAGKHFCKKNEALQSNNDMPPLIVHYVDHSFELCDGNHRFEALTQLGVKEYPVIIWITEKQEYEEFTQRYRQYL